MLVIFAPKSGDTPEIYRIKDGIRDYMVGSISIISDIKRHIPKWYEALTKYEAAEIIKFNPIWVSKQGKNIRRLIGTCTNYDTTESTFYLDIPLESGGYGCLFSICYDARRKLPGWVDPTRDKKYLRSLTFKLRPLNLSKENLDFEYNT